MPLSEHEQRILAELEESLVRHDPKFAERVRSEAVYPHASRNCKLAVVGFVVGLVILVALYSGSVAAGLAGVVVMFVSAVFFERNLRRLGTTGWHDIVRSRRDRDRVPGGAARPTGAPGTPDSSGPNAPSGREWLRTRLFRRDR